ncbi:MAG: hypothetical protein P4L84_28745 [Isosphaeraceae bacterium]|nr:hypothetical protein [Isosphaeraceae bacterium]
MKTTRPIRNCPPVFRFVCPKRWEALTPTEERGVRHCGQCDQRAYLCATDEETVTHARAGHCIAREMPDAFELPRVYVGQPAGLPPVTPQQEEARRAMLRERGVDDAIKNAQRSSRCCARCKYPAPDWRVECRVCGFEMGRAAAAGGQDG